MIEEYLKRLETIQKLIDELCKDLDEEMVETPEEVDKLKAIKDNIDYDLAFNVCYAMKRLKNNGI